MAPPYGLGLDHFMYQKQQVILSKILMLNSEIYQRYTLRGQSLYHINLDQCTCRNLIYHIGEDVLDKRRIELERKERIKKEVQGWSWNLSIFDIYDTLRDLDGEDQAAYLEEALSQFPGDRDLIKDLAIHLGFDGGFK